MTRRAATRSLAPLLVAGLAATGCMYEAPTQQGSQVAWLYWLFMAAAAVVFVVVVGLMLWAIVRYRGQPGPDVVVPRPSHGNLALEITWWALPTLLVGVLIVLTTIVLAEVDAREEEPAVVVGVEGFQWGWRFTYEDSGVVVAGTAQDPPTIQLPVGETVAFVITSEDVVHSFNLPRFLIKRDAIPSRVSRFDVVIEQEGTYTGQCGEFCGLLHARQLFSIDAVPPDEFEAWIAAQAAIEGDS